MNIGVIIGRIGGVDGVALESVKWIEVFRSMGHKVFIASGLFQHHSPEKDSEFLVPEMSFFAPESVWSQKRAFFYPETDPDELITHTRKHSGVIYGKLRKWAEEKKLQLIVSENLSSLPSQIETGLAVRDLVLHTGIPTITHDHDFAWDRGDRFHSSNKIISDYIASVFPLRASNSVHAVINSYALNILKEKYNRAAVNIPNVMDFDKPFGQPGPDNEALPEKLGFSHDDLLLFQVSHLIRRKKIETAIDLVHRLGDKKVKLIITGDYNDDAGSAYHSQLENRVRELGLGNQVRFASELFEKGLLRDRKKMKFSLSDAYARAAACTYFSSNEGFGNVIVEAILARRPLFVNNYQPVFMTDIGSKGIRTVMIEHGNLTDNAVKEMAAVLYNPALAAEMTAHNFELGKKYFSYDTLREMLTGITEMAFQAAGKNP